MLIYILPFATAFLYRFGGSNWKPARRFGIPILLWICGMHPIPCVVLSVIFHFNLDEIEEKDWDDVFCYGLAQAWCMSWMSPWSGLVGLSWITMVLLSNKGPKIDWMWAEIVQGGMIGLVCLL